MSSSGLSDRALIPSGNSVSPKFCSQFLKEAWKEKIRFSTGCFEYSAGGWQGVDKNYESDVVKLTLEIGQRDELGCATGKCLHDEKRWFGKVANTRGEFNVYRHMVAKHVPMKITKATRATSGQKRSSRTLLDFFTSDNSAKRPKQSSNPIKESSIGTESDEESQPILDQKKPSSTIRRLTNNEDAVSCTSDNAVAISQSTSNKSLPDSPSKSVDLESIKSAQVEEEVKEVLDESRIQKPWYILAEEEKKQSVAFRCQGIKCNIPEPRERNFPLLIDTKYKDPQFIFDLRIKNVCSIDCTLWVFLTDVGEDESILFQCIPCMQMNADPTLEALIEKSTNEEFHVSKANLDYLTQSQLRKKIIYMREKNIKLRLELLNKDRKVLLVCCKLDDFKALMINMVGNNIPRIQQILRQGMKRGRSIEYTNKLLHKAREGLYRPKGYNDEDLDLAIINYKIGGSRVAYANNHSNSHGGASQSTVKRRAYVPRFLPISSDILHATVMENFMRFMFNDKATSELDKGTKVLYTMMIDDVKTERRLRVDEATGEVIGLCYHACVNDISTKVRSKEDCIAIRDAVNAGDAHYGTEMTTIAFGANREKEYHPTIVACSAGCLNNDPAERTKKLLEMCLTIYIRNPKGQKLRGTLSTIQPDGAIAFVRIGHQLFFKEPMQKSHPLYEKLSKLPLFCLYSAIGEIERVTMGCEEKHVFKRTRERLKSDVGITFLTFNWNKNNLRQFLHASGSNDSDLHTMFNTGYADAMNVPAMILLFKAIAAMKDKGPNDFGKYAQQTRIIWKELVFLSMYCELILTVLCRKVTLVEYMEATSTIMHINLVIYRSLATRFLPSQNFSNMQRLSRSKFWSLANAQKDNVQEYYPFLDSGDRLEESFGCLRTLAGGASGTGDGMDCLQCCERISGVNQCEAVFARRPELRRMARHLKTSNDHMNPSSYISTGNKGDPEDRDRVQVTNVSLQHTYISGRRTAVALLKQLGVSTDKMDWKSMKDTNIDMLRPWGQFVGISSNECKEQNVPSGGENYARHI